MPLVIAAAVVGRTALLGVLVPLAGVRFFRRTRSSASKVVNADAEAVLLGGRRKRCC